MKRIEEDLKCKHRVKKSNGCYECKKGKNVLREILKQEVDQIGTTIKFGKWSCENCKEREE